MHGKFLKQSSGACPPEVRHKGPKKINNAKPTLTHVQSRLFNRPQSRLSLPALFEGGKGKKKKKNPPSVIRKPAADQLYILTSTLADHRRVPVKEYSELRLFDLHAIPSYEIVPKPQKCQEPHIKKKWDVKLPDVTPEERDEKEKKGEKKKLFGNVRGEGGIRERTLAKTSD